MFLTKPRSNGMSLQKRPISNQRQTNKNMQIQRRSQVGSLKNLSSYNVAEMKYICSLSQQDSQSTTAGVTWKLVIQKDPTWKKVFLDIRSLSTIILNTISQQFPGGICLAASQLTGVLDRMGNATHVLATAKPKVVSGNTIAGDLTATSMIYQLVDVNCLWDITGVQSLNFYICQTNMFATKIPVPYAQQVVVQLAVLGVK